MTAADRSRIAALPDVVLAPQFAPGRRPRLVNTGYGGSVRTSFSGSGAYLAEAGIADGTLDGVVELYSTLRPDRNLQARGLLWKAQRALRRQRTSGFKFAPEFSDHLWHRHLPALAGTDVISNFQLLSREFFDRRAALDIGATFYVDGTLHDYLLGYAAYDVAAIDPATVAAAIAAEREGYERADHIAVMSSFTAETMHTVYGVAPERVHVIAPGANLPDAMAEQVIARRRHRRQRPPSDEVVVGFVGVYPERKGLPKLADAVQVLRAEGLQVRLRVVGRCPDDIAARDGVDALGYLSKTDEPGRFVDALAGMDLGCQLSSAEMYGIAMLEFLRCGIPILATAVGGASDVVRGGGSLAVAGDASVEEVAHVLREFVTDETLRDRLRHAAGLRSSQVRWQTTARALGALLSN